MRSTSLRYRDTRRQRIAEMKYDLCVYEIYTRFCLYAGHEYNFSKHVCVVLWSTVPIPSVASIVIYRFRDYSLLPIVNNPPWHFNVS